MNSTNQNVTNSQQNTITPPIKPNNTSIPANSSQTIGNNSAIGSINSTNNAQLPPSMPINQTFGNNSLDTSLPFDIELNRHDYHRQLSCLVYVIPLIIFVFFGAILVLILYKNTKEKYKIVSTLIFIMIQFLFLPFLIIFVLVNLSMIGISYFCFKKIYYFNLNRRIDWLVSKICCVKGNPTVTSIKVTSKNNPIPERANKYKDINEEADKSNTLNINVNNNVKTLFKQEVRQPPRMQVNKKKKGKFMEFLENALVSEDNTPAYVNLIKTIKEKAKENKKNSDNSQNVVKV